jgi:uncharacterized RDD family membrane protein YckC
MNTVRIQTTQNVDIEYELASLGDRILATLLDVLFQASYAIVGFVLMVLLEDVELVPGMSALLLILWLIPLMLYHFLFEWLNQGQTPGKRFMKIRVIRLDGQEPTVGNYLLRWLIRIVDTLFYGVPAMVSIVMTDHNQRIGDLAAHTTVIKLSPKTSFQDTLFEETEALYQPLYPQARFLKDEHARLIKEVLNEYEKSGNLEVLQAMYSKTIDILNMQNNEAQPLTFLRTILKDYNHFLNQ